MRGWLSAEHNLYGGGVDSWSGGCRGSRSTAVGMRRPHPCYVLSVPSVRGVPTRQHGDSSVHETLHTRQHDRPSRLWLYQCTNQYLPPLSSVQHRRPMLPRRLWSHRMLLCHLPRPRHFRFVWYTRPRGCPRRVPHTCIRDPRRFAGHVHRKGYHPPRTVTISSRYVVTGCR